jgi:hypothetical protein
MLSYLDYNEFKKACIETQQSMESFLEMGIIIKDLHSLDYWQLFSGLLATQGLDNFGLFEGRTLVSHGVVTDSFFSPFGVQLIGWTRTGYQNQQIGLSGLIQLTHRKLGQGFRFVELVIDKENAASRRVAEKAGYKLISEVPALGQGRRQSGTYCLYMIFSNQVKLVSTLYNKDPLDLLDHPGVDPAYRHLLENEELNEYFKWVPLPSLQPRTRNE